MSITFFVIQGLAAASAATGICPLAHAEYRLADKPTITAQFDNTQNNTFVTIGDSREGRNFRFRLGAASQQLGQELRFVGATDRDGTDLRFRPEYFKLVRGFFFAGDKRLVRGSASMAAPRFFFSSGLTNAIHSAGAQRPQAARSYVPAGMFVFARCRVA